jgi:predicted dehydrogenase
MTASNARPELRIGIVGHGFMGRAHALAWRQAPQVFALPVAPKLAMLAGRDSKRTDAAASRLGIDAATADWRHLVESDDIDVVDICTPVSSHAEIAGAALTAGKHVLCEKPLALNLGEACALAEAGRAAGARGQVAMVGYNYRRVPALALARQLSNDGKIGQRRQVRARYLQDWLADSAAPWSWRLDASQAGAGALADLGSHLIDLVHFILGEQLERVRGTTHTFVDARPAPDSGTAQHAVTVDDTCAFVGRGPDGTLGTFEVSRVANGRKNQLLIEIDGEYGSLAFNLERLNELQVYTAGAPGSTRGFETVMVTEPSHPYVDGWWPPGHVLGWDHTFVNQARDFLTAVLTGEPVSPDFSDGAYVQAVIDAIQKSTEDDTWRTVQTSSPCVR